MRDINEIIEHTTPQPTTCDLAQENDRLMQKVSALCKERDEAHRKIDQLVISLNDETTKVERLEAENRAKEQYISETISKVIIERDAAIADLRCLANNCPSCVHYNAAEGLCKSKKPCCIDGNPDRWEWRGVQEVSE